MGIEINTNNHNNLKPKEEEPKVSFEYNETNHKQQTPNSSYIVSFIIVMIIWFIMEVKY